MKQYLTSSEKETRNLAKKLARKISKGVVALYGELGAGKTTFIQEFAKGLGIKEKIISPTFILIRQHRIPNSQKKLFHIDLYRLDESKDLKSIGLEEILSNPNNLILIEWAEKAKNFLPKNTVNVTLKKIDRDKRQITIS